VGFSDFLGFLTVRHWGPGPYVNVSPVLHPPPPRRSNTCCGGSEVRYLNMSSPLSGGEHLLNSGQHAWGLPDSHMINATHSSAWAELISVCNHRRDSAMKLLCCILTGLPLSLGHMATHLSTAGRILAHNYASCVPQGHFVKKRGKMLCLLFSSC
jgi:hypothetical protein